jgi:hypothetical protein
MTAPKSTVEHVKAIRAALPKACEFDERDLALLDLAEQQARDIDALEADVRPWNPKRRRAAQLGIREARVLALEERGLLTEEERREIVSEGEYARNGGFKPNPYVTTPKGAAENEVRWWQEREDEAIEIAEALKRL